MTKKELEAILKKHDDWLFGKPDGVRANLRRADLIGADLFGANLRGASLCGANLSGANLCGANLSGADLRGASLCGANLSGANLCGADLRGADLRGADLSRADLSRADLSGASLCGANLSGANLRGADLRGAKNVNKVYWNYMTAFYSICCPESGAFIGWKKCQNRIVKLRITEDALRSSATTRKCRCSKAEVLAIETLDGTPSEETEVCSSYDESFVYRIGETVEVKYFDTDRWNECSTGIHFFITRGEAVMY